MIARERNNESAHDSESQPKGSYSTICTPDLSIRPLSPCDDMTVTFEKDYSQFTDQAKIFILLTRVGLINI